jgi:hypothetical protein
VEVRGIVKEYIKILEGNATSRLHKTWVNSYCMYSRRSRAAGDPCLGPWFNYSPQSVFWCLSMKTTCCFSVKIFYNSSFL